MESKNIKQKMNIKKRLTDTENTQVVTSGERDRGGAERGMGPRGTHCYV